MTSSSVAISKHSSPYSIQMLLSCSHLILDETSEGAASNIELMSEEGKMHLERWMVSFKILIPEVEHGISPVSNLVLPNSKSAALTVDNCNQASKARELLDARRGEVCKNSEETGNISLYFFFKILIICC